MMALEKYLIPLLFVASLAGCDPNVNDRRIYNYKFQPERKAYASKYHQSKSSSSYTVASSTCTKRDDHSAVGITVMSIPGTPLGMDAGGNIGIRPGAMMDDDDGPGFGGFQINP